MHIKGSHTFKTSQDAAWETLLNPEALSRCMPGCEQFETVGPEQYRATMRVGVAGVKGSYSGSIQVVDKEPPHHCKLTVDAAGSLGGAKGVGILTLSPMADGTTEVAYEGDVQVFGTVARVGQRLLGAAAKMLINQFFKCMEGAIPPNGVSSLKKEGER